MFSYLIVRHMISLKLFISNCRGVVFIKVDNITDTTFSSESWYNSAIQENKEPGLIMHAGTLCAREVETEHQEFTNSVSERATTNSKVQMRKSENLKSLSVFHKEALVPIKAKFSIVTDQSEAH